MRDKKPVDGWMRSRLGQLFELKYGRSLPESARCAGPVPVVGSAGVVGSHTTAAVKGPGIVVGRKGSIGHVTWLERDFWPIDTTYYVRLVDSRSNLRWVYQLLRTLNLRGLKRVPGIGTIPRCWEVVRLGEVVTSVDYGTNVLTSDDPQGVEILGMKNIGDGEVRPGEFSRGVLPDKERAELLLHRGDILFNRTNSIELVGKVGIVRESNGDDLSFASYLLRLRTDPDACDPWWLIGFLNDITTQASLRRMATKGASQANINPTSLRSLVVPLPQISEQREIATLLESVRERVVKEAIQVAMLTLAKTRTANALLSGQVRVGVGK